MTFDKFFETLTSDEQWFGLLRHYRDETIKKAAEKVFAQLVADKSIDYRPWNENRKHVYNILCKNPGDKVLKAWHEVEYEKVKKIEEEKKQKEWVPLTGEARMSKLKEWEAEIRKIEMQSSVPAISHKQAVEEGGWIPPKGPAHKMTTAMEAYNKERKIAYYRYCFDPITRDKLPTWMEEEDYNAEFDRIMIKEKKHPHWETLQEIH